MEENSGGNLWSSGELQAQESPRQCWRILVATQNIDALDPIWTFSLRSVLSVVASGLGINGCVELFWGEPCTGDTDLDRFVNNIWEKCINVCVCVCVCVCVYVYIYIYICTHTHTHALRIKIKSHSACCVSVIWNSNQMICKQTYNHSHIFSLYLISSHFTFFLN